MQDLDNLLRHSGLWRASTIDPGMSKSVASGFAPLDQLLPGAGWPTDGVTEVLHDQYGIGEMRLMLPALAHLSNDDSRWILMIRPPYIPYPPALVQAGVNLASVLIVQPKTEKEYLWAMEKALTSQSCSAVLGWPGRILPKQIRRLQVASKEGGSLNILFRDVSCQGDASPAELRVMVKACSQSPFRHGSAADVKILKRRGGWETEFTRIGFDDYLNEITPDFSEISIEQHDGQAEGLIAMSDIAQSEKLHSYEYQ